MHDHAFPTDRRTLLKGAAAGAMLLAPGAALAQRGDREAVRRAAEAGNPKVMGLVGATMGFVDFLYEIASVK